MKKLEPTLNLKDFAEGNNIDIDIANIYYSNDRFDIDTFKFTELILLKNLTEIIHAIDLCIMKKFTLSALKLIYAAIDNMAYLSTKSNKVNPNGYKRWINLYLLKKGELPCTAEEIYSARCGLLHQNIAANRESPRIRNIYYSIGEANSEQGSKHIGKPNNDRYVFVSIEALYKNFKRGIILCLEEVVNDESLKKQMLNRAEKYFVNIDD